jgi:WD40 repeat protein
MRLRQPETSQEFELEAAPLGTGGEANVYAIPGQSAIVAKVYHKPTAEHAEKLQAMLAAPPDDPMAKSGHASIAWPSARLVRGDEDGRFAGFLMPRIDQARHLNEYYIPKSRQQQCPLFHYGYLMRTARNLAAAVRAVHDRGYVIGDLSGANLLVTAQALVTLIDTDSFQVRSPDKVFRCRVATPEYTPPELQMARFAKVDRAPEHDAFGLGVLVFQLLMQGTHPFAGVYTGEGDPASIPKRIALGHWPYARGKTVPYKPNPHAPPWEALPPMVQALFLLCFEDGHDDPAVRPKAIDWQQGLAEAEKELTPCAVNSQHHYYRGAATCPWCALAKQQKRDPFPSLQALKNGQSGALSVIVPAKEEVLPDVLPADAPTNHKVKPRSPGGSALPTDLVKYVRLIAIGAACFIGFLLAATLVAWGAWRMTHRANPNEHKDSVVQHDPGEKPPDPPDEPPSDPPDEPPDGLPPDRPPVPPPEAPPFAEHPSILALAISEDGRRMLTGSGDSVGRIWDLSSGRLVHRLEGHTKPIIAVAFAPDGRQAVTASEDNTLRLWDATDARELAIFRGQTARGVVFTPDGRKIISAGTDGVWRSWDTVLGQPLQRVPAHTGAVRCLALSSDGKRLATGGDDGSMLVWDVASATKQFDVNKHPGGVRQLVFAADNRHLLSAGADSVVRLWDVDSAWEDRRWDNQPNCVGLAFVAGGKRALIALRDNIRLFDVKSGEELGVVRGPRQGGIAAVVTPGEQWVMIASDDRFLHRRPLPKPGDTTAPKVESPLAKKKPLPTGEILRLEGHERELRCVALLPDGRRAISAGADPWIAVWDLETGKEQRRLEGHTQTVVGLSISADGKRAVSGSLDGNVVLWDLEEGRALQTIAGNDPIHAVALAPDGKHLAASTVKGMLHAWSDDGKESWNAIEPKRPAISLAFSADGRDLLEVQTTGAITLRSAESGKVIQALPVRRALFFRALFLADSKKVINAARLGIQPLAIWDGERNDPLATKGLPGVKTLGVSADGRRAIVGDVRGNAHAFDLVRRELIATFPAHADFDVGLSADGRHAITAGAADHIIRIFDLKAPPGTEPEPKPDPKPEAGNEKKIFRGHDGPVDAVAIGPEGRYVLSASSADRTVRQWDPETGIEKRSYLPRQNDMSSTSFSKDGMHILTLHADSSLYVGKPDTGRWTRIYTGVPVPPFRRPGVPAPLPPVLAAMLTPDGRGVFGLSTDRVLFWNATVTRSTRPVRIFPHDRDGIDAERPFQMSNNTRLALLYGPNDVVVLNLATGKEVSRIKNEGEVPFVSAALSPDGSTAFTSGIAGGVLWEAETGKEVRKLTAEERFYSAAFSPNGRYLLTGDRRGVVRLFKVETGEEIKIFMGHEQVVRSIAFSTDGSLAATGSADATVRLWQMPEAVHVEK